MARVQIKHIKETVIVTGFVSLAVTAFVFGVRTTRAETDLAQLREHNRVLTDRLNKLSQSFAKVRSYTRSVQSFAKPEMTLAAKSLRSSGSSAVPLSFADGNHSRHDFFAAAPTDVVRFMEQVELIDNLEKQAFVLERRLNSLAVMLKANKSVIKSIPSIMPAEGYISSDFGVRLSPTQGKRHMHAGIDIAAPTGAAIVAPADGSISFVGDFEDLGKTVVIDHGNGILTRFGHADRTFVMRGQKVKRGQKIAAVGNTGRSTGPHVHYEVWMHNHPVDPRDYLFDMSEAPGSTVPSSQGIEARTHAPRPSNSFMNASFTNEG